MQTSQRALLIYMRHLSEENWAAGWLIGFEFTLWDWVLHLRSNSEPTSEFERTNLPDTEALSWLSEQAGGWWHWDETGKDPKFVPLGGWVEIYRNRPANGCI